MKRRASPPSGSPDYGAVSMAAPLFEHLFRVLIPISVKNKTPGFTGDLFFMRRGRDSNPR